jgi:hypothetical protein
MTARPATTTPGTLGEHSDVAGYLPSSVGDVGDGRGGFASRILRMPSPGHHSAQNTRQDTPVEIKVIDGRQATDRFGAAERIGRSAQTVKLLMSNRAESGFPAPLPGTGRYTEHKRDFFALDDLDAFKAAYEAELAERTMPRSHGVQLDGDPDELLDTKAFAEAIDVNWPTVKRYVRDSVPAWTAYEALTTGTAKVKGNRVTFTAKLDSITRDTITDVLARYGGRAVGAGVVFDDPADDALTALVAGDDFFLPYPDEEEPAARGGTTRWWKRRTVQHFIDHRPGTGASTGRPATKTATT